jgi:hypothetical protein
MYLSFGDLITYIADIFKEFGRKKYNNYGMYCKQHEETVKRHEQFEETHIFIW